MSTADDAEPDASGRWRRRTTVLAAVVVIAAAASLLFDIEVDVPDWANVPGVDLPFVGDDPLVCDVVDADPDMMVVLSGSPDTIGDHRFVWVNGEIDDALVLDGDRVQVSFGDAELIHLAVSTTREHDDRFWCGSADRELGVLER
ncbi:MAG: hypothetical protein F6K65_20400 [Moorea sp. SIO3C2]|nr:hypothetical protein [Moorena sp. SIO3C2]